MQHRLGLTAQHLVESLRRDPRELGVAQRHDIRAARAAGNQAHLPHHVPRSNAGQEAPSGRISGEGAETAAQHHVERIGRIAGGKELRTPWK